MHNSDQNVYKMLCMKYFLKFFKANDKHQMVYIKKILQKLFFYFGKEKCIKRTHLKYLTISSSRKKNLTSCKSGL